VDGMLSQDEINALLSGIDNGQIDINNVIGETKTEDAALSKADEDSSFVPAEAMSSENAILTETERDAVGEIANICMGSAATTLYSLVNRKVNITTPVVTLAEWSSVMSEFEKPCVFIQIKYTAGLDGHNILVLKENDVKVITDLMMGGDGTNTEGELGELHLSAISEAMNQMMGASATSLSTMLGKLIDISPPEASLIDLTAVNDGADIAPFLGGTFVKITFRMQIDDDLVDSSLIQLYPIDFAKYLCERFTSNSTGATSDTQKTSDKKQGSPAQQAPQMQSGMNPQTNMQQMNMQQMQMPQMNMQQMPQTGMPQMNMQQMPQTGMPQMNMQQMPQMQMPQMQNMNIQPAQFQSFTGNYAGIGNPSNIGLIMDVPLEVTVELGRTKKVISEILDFTPGTIIELDRIAGEPVDVLVNGKMVARGEVVVIEESFGIRVTEIIK